MRLGVGNAVPGVPAGTVRRRRARADTELPPSAVGTPGTAFPTLDFLNSRPALFSDVYKFNTDIGFPAAASGIGAEAVYRQHARFVRDHRDGKPLKLGDLPVDEPLF